MYHASRSEIASLMPISNQKQTSCRHLQLSLASHSRPLSQSLRLVALLVEHFAVIHTGSLVLLLLSLKFQSDHASFLVGLSLYQGSTSIMSTERHIKNASGVSSSYAD